jgi:CheY-like chemotaxis protein
MPKILLAEDNEFSRDLLRRRLEKAGYEIITAIDGKEAVHAARQHRPDLIIMDLDMPVMDGRAAIRAVRNDPRTFRTPIIVLTAHAEPDEVMKAVADGCNAYETKPIVLKRLLERIEEVLGATAPAQAS